MSTEILFANIGRKFKSLTVNYRPMNSNSGLHKVGKSGDELCAIRTLLNGQIKLTKAGDIWTPGFCPAKGGPASFSSKEDGIKQVISVTWAD
jgi:hypothetical protein